MRLERKQGQSVECLDGSLDLTLKMIQYKQKITRPPRSDDSPYREQRGQAGGQQMQRQQTSR